MKVLFACVVASVAFVLLSHSASAQSRVKPEDLSILAGKGWTGSLTYADYSSGKAVTISCDLLVSRTPGEKRKWAWGFTFPKEPKANHTDIVELSADGRTLDGEAVVERKKTASGELRIVTETKGEDDNKPAVIRHTYLISKTSFTKSKHVRFDGSTEFIERNTYRWTR